MTDMIKKQNFISVDKKTAINSYGEYFQIDEKVNHKGVEENNTATIIGFADNYDQNEIKVFTTKGSCHLDFLVKIKDD